MTTQLTGQLAAQCGLYEAALGIVADQAGAALDLPAAEQARELAEIRAYVSRVLARGTALSQGPESPGKRTGR